jgi:hypothetical protein
MDNNNSTPLFSSSNDQSTSFYPHQRNSSQQFDSGQTPLFDEFLTSPSSYIPVQNTNHSYTNVSYQGPTNDSTSSSSFIHHHNTTYPY